MNDIKKNGYQDTFKIVNQYTKLINNMHIINFKLKTIYTQKIKKSNIK